MSESNRPERQNQNNSRGSGDSPRGSNDGQRGSDGSRGNDGRGNPQGQSPNGPAKFGRPAMGWVMLVALMITIFLMLSFRGSGTHKPVEFSLWNSEFQRGNVIEQAIGDTYIRGKFDKPVQVDGREVREFEAAIPPLFGMEFAKSLTTIEYAKSTRTVFVNNNNLWLNLLIPLIPWVIIILAVWFILSRQLRNAGAGGGMLGNFGRSRHKITSKEHTNVTFEDVAGVDEAKDEVREIVEFLKNPKKFQRLGGRIPRGVLLMGEPGTGKTLLAKAIAGEADVPFYSISGSDFVEMFVGVGASRVRDLFKSAKDNSPCIIFLDEIDAVGRRRGAGFNSGGHDEREQTLNAILVEMDGFDTNDQVIVCAATNRLDVLDPALTRPGRFDRTVQVSLPDVKGRLEILKVHARKVKLGPNVDLARLARATPGFSGADLAAIINESALGATLQDKEFIEHSDLEEARDKVRFGRARRSRVIDEKEKIATAYHEAGHAVIQFLESDADPIHKVTIIPRGNYGGATMSLPEKDRQNYSRKWCIATMKTLFGGRIAEEMFTGDINTGAFGDIRMATGLARRMVREWGMNDRIGFVFYGEDDSRPSMFDLGGAKEYSDETARAIDEEVKKLIDLLYAETRSILEANRDRLDALAKALLKHETLDASDVDRVMRGEFVTRPSVSDLLDDSRPPTTRPVPPTPPAGPELPPGAIPAT